MGGEGGAGEVEGCVGVHVAGGFCHLEGVHRRIRRAYHFMHNIVTRLFNRLTRHLPVSQLTREDSLIYPEVITGVREPQGKYLVHLNQRAVKSSLQEHIQ